MYKLLDSNKFYSVGDSKNVWYFDIFVFPHAYGNGWQFIKQTLPRKHRKVILEVSKSFVKVSCDN